MAISPDFDRIDWAAVSAEIRHLPHSWLRRWLDGLQWMAARFIEHGDFDGDTKRVHEALVNRVLDEHARRELTPVADHWPTRYAELSEDQRVTVSQISAVVATTSPTRPDPSQN